jgi:hypothetical protein
MFLEQYSRNFLHPQHTIICQTRDGTPQNVGPQNEGSKLYMAINMYLHINTCPVSVQAYANKT